MSLPAWHLPNAEVFLAAVSCCNALSLTSRCLKLRRNQCNYRYEGPITVKCDQSLSLSPFKKIREAFSFFPCERSCNIMQNDLSTENQKRGTSVTQQANSDVAQYWFPFHTGEIIPDLHLSASIVSDEISPCWHCYRLPSPAPCMWPPPPLQIPWNNFARSGFFYPLPIPSSPPRMVGPATGLKAAEQDTELPGCPPLASSAHPRGWACAPAQRSDRAPKGIETAFLGK